MHRNDMAHESYKQATSVDVVFACEAESEVLGTIRETSTHLVGRLSTARLPCRRTELTQIF